MTGMSRRIRSGSHALALALALGVCCSAAVSHAQTEDLPTAPDLEGARSFPAPSVDVTRSPSTREPVLAGPVDPKHYRLGPGDVLSLEYGGRAQGSRTLVVDGEGRVRVPSLGVVTVGRLTLADARNLILARLKPLLPGATMDLRLLEPRIFKVFVLGEVKNSGVQQVVGSARALEAIEAAGGVTATGSERNVRLIRADGSESVSDLERFRRTGDWSANPYLEDGDRVVVPPLTGRIFVYGAVALPGAYEYRSDDSLATAIRIAGGVLPEAREDSVLIVRFFSATGLDTLVTSLAATDIPLQADDRVFVRSRPEWHRRRNVTLSGEVMYPGVYAVMEGTDRVSTLIRQAGGFTANAARRGVHLMRPLADAEPDVEYDRLSRLSREQMTNSEYQTFRSKLARRQSVFLVDFSSGVPSPPQADVFLQDGDRIDVSRVEMSVRVDGSVRRPGLIEFVEGRSIRDYVALAGGPSRRGKVGDIRVTRAGSGNTVFARDIRRIEPGDFIWVPEKKDTSFWSVFKDALVVAGQVATIVIVVDQFSRR